MSMFVLSKWQHEADVPPCVHFSTVISPSWITEQTSVGNFLHRGASACRERLTSFKIVTWTKQTWTKHHNTKLKWITRVVESCFGGQGHFKVTISATTQMTWVNLKLPNIVVNGTVARDFLLWFFLPNGPSWSYLRCTRAISFFSKFSQIYWTFKRFPGVRDTCEMIRIYEIKHFFKRWIKCFCIVKYIFWLFFGRLLL